MAAIPPSALAQDAPLVRSVRPNKISPGEVTLTVRGAGFDSGATVYFGPQGSESPLPTTYKSARSLDASATVAEEWAPAASLFVRNGDGSQSNTVAVAIDTGGKGGGKGNGNGGGGGGGGGETLTREQAMRFLYQSTWGPTEESIAHLMDVGKQAFLDEQFAARPSTYPDPPDPDLSTSFRPAQDKFFQNAVHGDDQLRQRMAFFLSQIWVVSANTTGQIQQMVPYLRTLDQHALGNYRDIMLDVTLNPTMGRYLDMVNNRKANPETGISPNENYGRELLQLFSVGPIKLNLDGSPQTDGSGAPVPSYTEETVQDLARVFTGWTYPTRPGGSPRCGNPSHYDGPMIVVCQSRHDADAKTLMDGYAIPAGLTAEQELDLALDHIFEHPNVGPFVAFRMIRHFVTSNPDPAYVGRVAQVFNDNGQGVRGDMRAVIEAVLLDPDAESADPLNSHLREPILYANALLRAFGATLEASNPIRSKTRDMGQEVFRAPSVFNYFHLAHGTFHGDHASHADGPEFGIHTLSNSVRRADFAYHIGRNSLGTGASVDLSDLLPLAGDPGALVDAVIAKLVSSGALSAAERQSVLDAVNAVSASDSARRVEYAIFLVATTRFQVQH